MATIVMNTIRIYESLPEGLLDTPINQLHSLLDGPSLFHLKGKSEKTLFISTLLHGNETSGVLALNRFLKKYKDQELPISLCIFYGNTLAAKTAQRHLPDQIDWNRIWAPQELEDSFEKEMAMELLEYASKLSLIANIDIHNNTGNNPPYGCINNTKSSFIKLSKLFNEKVIYFTEPHQVQSMAFASFCPSMTIEAGLPGELQGIELIQNFLEKLMNITSFDELPEVSQINLFHTVAKINLPYQTSIDFENSQKSFSDYSFRNDIEKLNFIDISPQTPFCFAKKPFSVTHYQGSDVFHDFFEYNEEMIRTKKSFTLCMLTKDKYVIQNDCLGYIMEYIQDPAEFIKSSSKSD